MKIGIATVQVPFVQGGAELHARELRASLIRAGHEADIITVPFRWYPAERIPEQILACRLLDVTESSGMKIDRLIGLKFPAYFMPHPNKVMWILHQHRSAYDLWDHPFGDINGTPHGERVRDIIREADTRLIPEARRVFANSRTVADRLYAGCGLSAEPLYHPPPGAERYTSGEYGDFFLMPSRVNPMKRQALVIEALFHTRANVRVCFVGASDSAEYFETVKQRAAQLPPGRVEFLGNVSMEQKLSMMASCRGVIYPPFDEDFGYVTLEAMLSARPVVTCTDSGGPLELIVKDQTGMIVPPEPEAMAEALDRLAADAALAKRLGQGARAAYRGLGIGWDKVVQCLLA